MADCDTIKLELPAQLKSFNFTFECSRPGPVTVEISLQRPLKWPRSQHSTMDGPDSSETGTQKPPMLARWIDAQTERQSFLSAVVKTNTRGVDESIIEPESDLPGVKNINITPTTVVDESVTEPETDSKIDPSQEVQTSVEFTRYYEAQLANEAQLAK
ncbi:hypothetical protein DFH29DRAFT_875593 [Suillus ampliporus]|nr:hypothetical protein DFH29DRAFT_875593 [Suillus ampliporus]